MDALMKLSRAVQVVLGGTALYLRSQADGVSVPNIRALSARGGSGSTQGGPAEPTTQPPAPPAAAGEPPPATDPSPNV